MKRIYSIKTKMKRTMTLLNGPDFIEGGPEDLASFARLNIKERNNDGMVFYAILMNNRSQITGFQKFEGIKDFIEIIIQGDALNVCVIALMDKYTMEFDPSKIKFIRSFEWKLKEKCKMFEIYYLDTLIMHKDNRCYSLRQKGEVA